MEPIIPSRIWIIILLPFALITYIFVFNNEYIDGKIPKKNTDEYLIYMNDKVFTSTINEYSKEKSTAWFKVVDSSKKRLQLYALDSVKFVSKLDKLAKQTVNEFDDYGFKWGKDDEGNYFSLPRERGWEEDYVITPAWLVSLLIDEGIIDTKEKVSKNNDETNWWPFIVLAVAFSIFLFLQLKKRKNI